MLESKIHAQGQQEAVSGPESGNVLLRIHDLTHKYKLGEVETTVLHEINLTVRAGEFLAILGPSGCGKTTLLNLLGGLEKPTHGVIQFGTKRITDMNMRELGRYRRDSVSFIFQFYNLLPNLTAAENIAAGLEVLRLSRDVIKARVARYLAAVGLPDKGDSFPSQLSGGMQQRVAIARALAKESPLILADEPTGNLDQESGKSIMDLIQNAHKTNHASIVLITHDQEVAKRADRIISLKNGRVGVAWT